MKKIKRKLILILVLLFAIGGCVKEGESKDGESLNEEQVNVASLKGPTSMGMIKLIDDSKEDKNYDIQILTMAEEIVKGITNESIDIANIPTNLASVIYNKTEGEVQVLNINTLGVVYIVENGDSLNSIDDLKGKTIYGVGKGQTPELILNNILKNYDLHKDVNIEFKSEASEVAAILSKEEGSIGLLPEPFVTVALSQNPNIRRALDLNEEWMKVNDNNPIVTGVTIARKKYIDENPEKIREFSEAYKESVSFIREDINTASNLVEKYDIVKAPIAKKSIDYLNIDYISGEEMKKNISSYLNILFKEDAKSIGGKLPDDNFYYEE